MSFADFKMKPGLWEVSHKADLNGKGEMHMTFEGKFLNKDCGGVKPLIQ